MADEKDVKEVKPAAGGNGVGGNGAGLMKEIRDINAELVTKARPSPRHRRCRANENIAHASPAGVPSNRIQRSMIMVQRPSASVRPPVAWKMRVRLRVSIST